MFLKRSFNILVSCVFTLLVSGCQFAQKSTRTSASTSGIKDTETIPADMAAYSIPKSQRLVKAQDLYHALAKAERLITRKGGETNVTAFDVICEIDTIQDKLLCHANSRPENSKGGQRVDFSETDSGILFSELSNLPISKGEGGLATDFVQCRSVKVPGVEDHYSCSISAPIEYIPHSGMSPIVEGED